MAADAGYPYVQTSCIYVYLLVVFSGVLYAYMREREKELYTNLYVYHDNIVILTLCRRSVMCIETHVLLLVRLMCLFLLLVICFTAVLNSVHDTSVAWSTYPLHLQIPWVCKLSRHFLL